MSYQVKRLEEPLNTRLWGVFDGNKLLKWFSTEEEAIAYMELLMEPDHDPEPSPSVSGMDM
ncbi:hypothetical protein [Teredinibacter sp. KSP-S5-2]|uniref:hypothetical protein n=1 Tax=Teredinibacter sp. KSP-S5-2 TaxID=3034506 RepID=UPI00293427CA|nr:hypothetical protein [Teredinibacter sp. KSP-S5-2]WNO11243.1 hypothetical protein P5V12_08660 [Teredinibacter sp. KSP-S5-2]